MTDRYYQLYSSFPGLEHRKVWAEIDLGALRYNYRLLRDTVCHDRPDVRTICVVKADAYGHGAPECVRALLGEGCDFFAVSCLEEAEAVRAVCLRERKNADVLILGYTPPDLADRLAHSDLIQALLSEEYADELNRKARSANVTVRTHIALDTGMNRIGIPAHSDTEIADAVRTLERIRSLSGLSPEGMFTHFACADEEEDGDTTDLQASRYRLVRAGAEARGIVLPFHHVCNSVASVRRPQDRMNGVRFGILLYGARPSDAIDLPLKPVMKLKTVVSNLHKLLPGEGVGYGGTFRSPTERLIATLPIGYADGLLRAYSGAFVTVRTADGAKSTPIVGRICMDQCMIDVTGLGVRPDDTVTLFGDDPKELHALAQRAGTIDYECLCLISSRVPRVCSDQND